MNIVSIACAVICLLLTSCAGMPDSVGFQPLPDKFMGKWEAASKSAAFIDIALAPHPDGGALTMRAAWCPYDGGACHIADITEDIKVFAIKGDTAFAIVRTTAKYRATGKKSKDIFYQYYAFVYKHEKNKYYEDESVTVEYGLFQIPLTEHDWDLSASTHWDRISHKFDCKKYDTCYWNSGGLRYARTISSYWPSSSAAR